MSEPHYGDLTGRQTIAPTPATSVGISLRDWFAGQAIIGIAAYAQEPVPPATLARAAYGLADAMLAARQQKDENDGR
jgi:hypothetical protein